MKRVMLLVLLSLPTLAHASTVTVNLGWDPDTLDTGGNPLTDLAGYTVYKSTRDFNNGGVWLSTATAQADSTIAKINVPASSTTASISGLSDNTLYYFRLTAFDTQGQQSAFNVNASGADAEVSFALYVAPAPPKNLVIR